MSKAFDTKNSSTKTLEQLGWCPHFETALRQDERQQVKVARVSLTEKQQYRISSPEGEFRAVVTGRFRHLAPHPADFPTTGDWVIYDRESRDELALIREVLPRKSRIARMVAGRRSDEQLIAANVDHIFIVTGLDDNFNLRRIERYLCVCRDSGATLWIVLNKADLLQNRSEVLKRVEETRLGCPFILTSSYTGEGLELLRQAIRPGQTVGFIGSSGVGKSSLINALMNLTVATTAEVRSSDSRGRHTTTQREMYFSDEGIILMDTPGMRELQLTANEDSVRENFADIALLAMQCRFADCSHTHEPDCAVRASIEEGLMEAGRLENQNKQLKEVHFQENRGNKRESSLGKKRWKSRTQLIRNIKKDGSDANTDLYH